jgi:antitoxin PrlF
MNIWETSMAQAILVTESKLTEIDEDPIVESFLSFLANDMQQRNDKLHLLTENMCKSVENLVGDVEIDLDASLLEDE